MAYSEYVDELVNLGENLSQWILASVKELHDMKYHISLIRWYRANWLLVQGVAATTLVILLTWFFVKGYLFQIARKARHGLETTIATKVEQIANQFDDALTVSYRKATWELVKDNVGVYALQGRRATMEDRFTFVNKLEHTNTSLYGVFDGHGGEVSHLF